MRAVVYDRYGPPEVLRIEERPTPAPAVDEVLVAVHAAAVTRADCATREANRKSGRAISLLSRAISGVRAPRQPILGSEFAGVVERVGAAVTDFARGDRVFGSTGFGFGAYAEFLCIRQDRRIARMPANCSFVEAASVPDGGLNSLWCLRRGGIRPGEAVLVYGASGAIGTAGVQLARELGATVTGVTTAKNLELVRRLGADHVIDYTKDDFTRDGERYDVIFDAVGKLSYRRSASSLRPGGRYLATDGLGNLMRALWTKRFGDKRVVFELPPRYTRQDVLFLKELVEKGAFKPVVDRTYPMEQVVEATRYVETEQKVGNVILTIRQ